MKCPCEGCVSMCFCRLKSFDDLLRECNLMYDYYFGETNPIEVEVSVWTALDLDSLYKSKGENYAERFFESDFWR